MAPFCNGMGHWLDVTGSRSQSSLVATVLKCKKSSENLSSVEVTEASKFDKIPSCVKSVPHAVTERSYITLCYGVWIFPFKTILKSQSSLVAKVLKCNKVLRISRQLNLVRLQNLTKFVVASRQCTIPLWNGAIVVYVTVYEYFHLGQISK